MMNECKKTLICSIINYLKKQLNSGGLDEGGEEGLAIGIQCIQAAYNVSDEASSDCALDLEEIIDKHLNVQDVKDDVEEQKTVAEILKNEGNNHMNSNDFKEAIACYTKAIELDPKNAIYYCNRAAALNSFGSYDSAIEDCKTALKFNPLYHKAYARMGVAYKAKNQLKDAKDSFQQAIRLQPDNEGYRTQLKEIEQALKNSPENVINLEINGTRISLGNVEHDIGNILNMATSMFNRGNPL